MSIRYYDYDIKDYASEASKKITDLGPRFVEFPCVLDNKLLFTFTLKIWIHEFTLEKSYFHVHADISNHVFTR